MAEDAGFEPAIPVTVYTLSKRAPSATRPTFLGDLNFAATCGRAFAKAYASAGPRIAGANSSFIFNKDSLYLLSIRFIIQACCAIESKLFHAQ